MIIEKGRLGEFFLFIGGLLLIIFFTTGQSQDPPAWLFFVGLAMTGLGVYFIRKDWKPPAPSQRFRILRKSDKKKTKKEKKSEQRDKTA